jgi:hypothetical protein
VKTKEKNKDIIVKNKNELRELEQFYTTNKVDTMFDTIEAKKQELVEDMIKYANEHTVACSWNKDGEAVAYKVNINPLVITNYFFKPITPITSQEPIYNAEKLGMVFDYYCDILASVNDKIGYFPSSLTSFCRLAGITLNTLRQYKNSTDYNMRVVVEKIYDQIGDENITMSQMGIVKERTTMFKMKSQNELVEKQQPNININITEKPDFVKIEERIGKYKQFASKKDKK